MKRFFALAVLFVGALAVASCTLIGGPSGPPPLEAPSPTPLPAAEVTLWAAAPPSTPTNAALQVEFFDELAGFSAPASVIPMQGDGAGTWSVELTPASGSVLYYRYARNAPDPTVEGNARGNAIVTRLALVDGATQIHDVIATWVDAPENLPTGRVVGTLTDAATGAALPDILVSVGGRSAFSDGQGGFRIDDLAPGLHTLVALSPSGAYLPAQQGAIIAAESETPAVLAMTSAPPIVVTFQATVPPDTPGDVPLRVAGNVLGLGNTFAGLSGGPSGSVGQMPQLVKVDPTHYLGVVQLYGGTDLRYRYTLGDGTWNAERAASGGSLTRQVVLPQTDLTLDDVISTWHGPSGEAVSFHITSAAGLPPADQVSLQLRPSTWYEAIPMWPAGPAEWSYSLFSPLESGRSLGYRYCRNQLCGIADDTETPGADPTGRPATPSGSPQSLNDTVNGWSWWQANLGGAVVVAPEITPRADYEVGYEVAPAYTPTWLSSAAPSLKSIADSGANAVLFSPAWVLRENAPVPQILFDTQHAPLGDELVRQIDQATRLGLQAGLHPALIVPDGSLEDWWEQAPRDGAWWTVWFERYRSFLLTYAALAERAGASKLVVGGPEVAPALPGGVLADGSPSGAPVDAETRWRTLLEEVRAVYHGPLAFEIDFGRTLQLAPPFLDAVDEVHVYWHVSLGEGLELPAADMQAAAFSALDGSLLADPALEGKPIVLSVEYLSIDGGATACAAMADGSCRPPQSFDAGADPEPDLALDLAEQSDALNAVILAAYARDEIQGFYARRYYPPVALHDKSASVNGKPAGQMLGYWYSEITGP
ncbi:MAG: hypothetical protein HW375_869 [Anaerolineales bacterium]|nr:hypothetical protein [Anaerolineales bacterium]